MESLNYPFKSNTYFSPLHSIKETTSFAMVCLGLNAPKIVSLSTERKMCTYQMNEMQCSHHHLHVCVKKEIVINLTKGLKTLYTKLGITYALMMLNFNL
jgi:hypothetical protein